MTRSLLVALLLAAPPAFAQEAAPPAFAQEDVRALVLSAPATIVGLDVEKLEGEPSRLSWSADGRLLYLRTTVIDRWGNERSRHHLIDLATRTLRTVEQEPPWAASYWAGKSALAALGAPDFRVDLESREERLTATGVAGAGALAGHGDPTLGSELGPQGAAIASAAMQAQKVTRSIFKLRGEIIGEFVNTPPVPGLTFGWGPGGSPSIAFVDSKGRLGLMDKTGRRRIVEGPTDVRLPGWSPDGGKLALVQKSGKKQYAVCVLEVSAREPDAGPGDGTSGRTFQGSEPCTSR